ncbi:TrmB family transcriptional regulator [Streptomyces sp. NPDC127197]|uniref:TrmB family transcriptional regulator n=1 Tax=Streptomyces sp. NPDC127197 TaxID=3345388 RepID=UPI003625A24F
MGLSVAETDVYRALVVAVTASAGEVSTATGLDTRTAERLLGALEEKGLARRVEGASGRFAANPPDVTLLPRLERRADELGKARSAVSELMETYRRNAWIRDAGEVVEFVTGAGALRQRLRQVQDSAREEMLWFCRAQYVAMPSGTNQAEFDALARGVSYRVLYEQAFFDDTGGMEKGLVPADQPAQGQSHQGPLSHGVDRVENLRCVVSERRRAVRHGSRMGAEAFGTGRHRTDAEEGFLTCGHHEEHDVRKHGHRHAHRSAPQAPRHSHSSRCAGGYGTHRIAPTARAVPRPPGLQCAGVGSRPYTPAAYQSGMTPLTCCSAVLCDGDWPPLTGMDGFTAASS